MTGYDLQLHLRCRIAFEKKRKETKKEITRYPSVLQVLTPGMSQIFLGKEILIYRVVCVYKAVNFKDLEDLIKKSSKYFSRTLTELKDFSRRLDSK